MRGATQYGFAQRAILRNGGGNPADAAMLNCKLPPVRRCNLSGSRHSAKPLDVIYHFGTEQRKMKQIGNSNFQTFIPKKNCIFATYKQQRINI
ncbi:MAG: hypothetical protein LBU73_01825 [Helicobacteraceae bacterium]|jgi:hypothetical protein|nr:hypothetical protein [Helicobacteraceae bacterium]